MWRRDLNSEWTGQRCFKINGRAIYQGTYSYDYIRYRLDVNLTTPMRKNSDEAVPAGLLPVLRGRRYMRRFFQPLNMQRQQRRVGLVRWIDHASLPGNCVYFHDLVTLPDLSLIRAQPDEAALEDELSRGDWEANLAGNWMVLLAEEQNERMVRYLTWVTFDRLAETGGIESTKLISILDGWDSHFEKFVEAELVWIGADTEQERRARDEALRRAKGHLLAKGHSKYPEPDSSFEEISFKRAAESIARHAALFSDLRRAWHSISHLRSHSGAANGKW